MCAFHLVILPSMLKIALTELIWRKIFPHHPHIAPVIAWKKIEKSAPGKEQVSRCEKDLVLKQKT
jgi:hypothetical protein